MKPNPLQAALGVIEQVPLVDAFRRRRLIDQPIALPHLMFSALYRESSSVFMQHMIPGGADQVQRFWQSMAGHPALAGHPMVGVPGWQDKFIPLSLHGDGVPVTGVGKAWSKGVEAFMFERLPMNPSHLAPSRSYSARHMLTSKVRMRFIGSKPKVYSFTSMLCDGAKVLRHWIIALLQKSMVTSGTLDTVWQDGSWDPFRQHPPGRYSVISVVASFSTCGWRLPKQMVPLLGHCLVSAGPLRGRAPGIGLQGAAVARGLCRARLGRTTPCWRLPGCGMAAQGRPRVLCQQLEAEPLQLDPAVLRVPGRLCRRRSPVDRPAGDGTVEGHGLVSGVQQPSSQTIAANHMRVVFCRHSARMLSIACACPTPSGWGSHCCSAQSWQDCELKCCIPGRKHGERPAVTATRCSSFPVYPCSTFFQTGCT